MATINLGAIKFNWKGAYNSSTSYAVDDVVSSGGNSYVCIQAHSNQAVGNATAYWNIMSSAGTNGTNGTDLTSTLTAQGDMLYRDGSGLQKLAKGTASQELRMNSGATAPEWFTPSASGGLLKSDYSTYSTVKTHTTSYTNISSSVSFTPTSASSDLIIQYSTLAYMNGGTGIGIKLMIGGSEVGTNMWATNSYMTAYSGSGTDYVTVNVFAKYDNTSTSAKTIEVQGRRYDNSTNVYSQYDGRPSQLLIMEIGV